MSLLIIWQWQTRNRPVESSHWQNLFTYYQCIKPVSKRQKWPIQKQKITRTTITQVISGVFGLQAFLGCLRANVRFTSSPTCRKRLRCFTFKRFESFAERNSENFAFKVFFNFVRIAQNFVPIRNRKNLSPPRHTPIKHDFFSLTYSLFLNLRLERPIPASFYLFLSFPHDTNQSKMIKV